LANESTYCASFQGVRVEDHTHADSGWQAERSRKTERMKEGQNAKDLVVRSQHENLVQLFHIGRDIVVRQHHAFRIASAAAGEDDGGRVIERYPFAGTGALFNKPYRQEP